MLPPPLLLIGDEIEVDVYSTHDTEKPPATPVLPMIGQDVFFRLDRGPHKGEDRPAKVVRVPPGSSNGTAVLAVFTCGSEDGLPFGECPTVVTAPHSYEAELGTWHVRRYA